MSPEPWLIAAIARNGVIGCDGGLPWRLPDDLKRFKRTTLGHSLVMGRKTWESLPGALPGRRSLVVTRDPSYRAEGAQVVTSLDAALEVVASVPGERAFVAGGSEIYALALPRVERMWLTRVDAEVAGDVFFPAWELADWRCVEREEHPVDARHAYAFRIEQWVRRRG